MSSLFEEGIKKGVIRYQIDTNEITYSGCQTKRSLNNPEEKVQAEE